MRSRSPVSNVTIRAQLLGRLSAGEQALDRARGAPRASRAEAAGAARATMRWSRSVPVISTRARGIASRQTAASVYASAP